MIRWHALQFTKEEDVLKVMFAGSGWSVLVLCSIHCLLFYCLTEYENSSILVFCFLECFVLICFSFSHLSFIIVCTKPIWNWIFKKKLFSFGIHIILFPWFWVGLLNTVNRIIFRPFTHLDILPRLKFAQNGCFLYSKTFFKNSPSLNLAWWRWEQKLNGGHYFPVHSSCLSNINLQRSNQEKMKQILSKCSVTESQLKKIKHVQY